MAVQLVDGITLEFMLAPNMVVFSHGFGVRRDGRGMFTQIAEALPEGVGYVLFDYNDIDDDNHTVRIMDLVEQTGRLQKVLAWTRDRPGVKSLSLVAHSMGCIVTALTQPTELAKVIFLAPPTSIGERTRKYFTTKKGAEKHDDMWVVPRNDGTVSVVPETFFDQYEQVDAMQVLLDFVAYQPLELVVAAADEVLQDADYEPFAGHPNVQLVNIAGASHDFAGNARNLLITTVDQELRG